MPPYRQNKTYIVWDDALVEKTVQALLLVTDWHIAPFTGDNWRVWNCRLQNLLRPYDGVLDILTGEATSVTKGYNSEIDDALLAIIDRKVHPTLYFFILNLGENDRGAAAYESLEDHYTLVHAPSVKQSISEDVNKLQQDPDEAFSSYAVSFKSKPSILMSFKQRVPHMASSRRFFMASRPMRRTIRRLSLLCKRVELT